MMLRHDLRTGAQICGKSAIQASLFVRHGRGVNRVYYMISTGKLFDAMYTFVVVTMR